MTVSELIQILQPLPANTPVLRSAFDHSYADVEASATTALYVAGAREWTEDHGEELTPEAEWGKRFDVIVIE